MSNNASAMLPGSPTLTAVLVFLSIASGAAAQMRDIALLVDEPGYGQSPFAAELAAGDPRGHVLFPGEPFSVGIVAYWEPASSEDAGPSLTADLIDLTVVRGGVQADDWRWLALESRPGPVPLQWEVRSTDPRPALHLAASAPDASSLPPGMYTVIASLDPKTLPVGLPPAFYTMRPKLAAVCFAVIPATDEDRLWLIYREIIRAEWDRNFQAAEEACLRLLAQYPTSVLTLDKLGDARLKLGNIEGARTAWTEEIRVITAGLDTRTPMLLEPGVKDGILSNAQGKIHLAGKSAP